MSYALQLAVRYLRFHRGRTFLSVITLISVAGVTGPMVNIDHGQQENLNVSTTGKSINAIRPFVGEGTLVWGARTLDGNSLCGR